MKRRRTKKNPWIEIYEGWTRSTREQKVAFLQQEFPQLIAMGAGDGEWDYMIERITPVLQMRALTGMSGHD